MQLEKKALILVGSGHLESTCYKIAEVTANCLGTNIKTQIILKKVRKRTFF